MKNPIELTGLLSLELMVGYVICLERQEGSEAAIMVLKID